MSVNKHFDLLHYVYIPTRVSCKKLRPMKQSSECKSSHVTPDFESPKSRPMCIESVMDLYTKEDLIFFSLQYQQQ